MMSSADRTQQVAVLLNLIGDDAAKLALDNLTEDSAKELRNVLDEYKRDPPTESEVQFVLDDFERYFSFALEHYQDQITSLQEDENGVSSENGVKGNKASKSGKNAGNDSKDSGDSEDEEEEEYHEDIFRKPELTGDLKQDLNLLDPYQIAYAIRNDDPNAIVVVMMNLTDSKSAKTLENLPSELRTKVFLQLANPMEFSEKVENQILKATLDAALKVETRLPDGDRAGQMVTLVRSLPKNIRGPLMEKLVEQDEELAAAVKKDLYQFEDIMRLGDRDVQKVLGQCDSDALVVSLVYADEELRTKVLSNMSKRARQTIEEELEFKSNASADEVENGQSAIVAVLVALDESGEIDFG